MSPAKRFAYLLCCAAFLGVAPGAGAQPSAAPAGERDSFVYNGAADVRYRDTDKETRGSYIAATRLQGDWTRRDRPGGAERAGARVQILLETDRRGTAADRLRTSELYGYYNFSFAGVAARVKAGQFVLPFGLIAVYDTPLQPIQPLYEKALGLRVDTGVALEGEYGPYRYTGAITTGAGPNRLDSGGGMITFRLSRAVATRKGVFEVGGSLLSGRGPITYSDTELPASGWSGARRYVDKTRIAGDGQYLLGPVTLRGEIVFGGDGEDAVWGYFAEGNYRVMPALTLVAFRKLWNFPQEPMSSATTGVGVNCGLGRGMVVRVLYEFQRDVPLPAGSSPVAIKRLTLQTRLDF